MNIQIKNECINLAAEILSDFELSRIPLENILFKCLRLCRILGDERGVKLFTFEISGYPKAMDGYMTHEAWEVSKLASRRYYSNDKDGKRTEHANLTSLAQNEQSIEANKLRLQSAVDPNISISSSNPNQYVREPNGNMVERSSVTRQIAEERDWTGKISGALYAYILNIYCTLSYGDSMTKLFENTKEVVDKELISICPEVMQKFVSVYNNIDSENSEDWSNAVNTCRRIIQAVADKLYPATEDIEVDGKNIKLGKENYINRLIAFIEKHKGSDTYAKVVGNNLSYLGERIDSIYDASNKGVHSNLTQREASTYIVQTYLLLHDILSLAEITTINNKRAEGAHNE